MEKPAIHHLFEALIVLKENISYVFIPVLLTSSMYLSHFVAVDFLSMFFLTIGIALFIIMPLFYGQFFEIINAGQKDTWGNIFNNYWLKVILVSLILKAPIVFLSLIDSQMVAMKEILSIIIEIVSIYILPLVLYEKKIISSIKLGIKCLVGNFKYSSPLVLVLLLAVFIPLLVNVVLKYIDIQILSYSLAVTLNFLSIFIDFTIFIAASLILKDKLIITYHEGT